MPLGMMCEPGVRKWCVGGGEVRMFMCVVIVCVSTIKD